MKQSLWMVGVYGLFLACGAGTVPGQPQARGDSAPATQPGVKETLADGSIEFARPGDWEEAKKNRTPLRAAWVSPDRKGMILVEVWPEGEITETTGPKTVSKLRVDRRKQAGVQIVMEATLRRTRGSRCGSTRSTSTRPTARSTTCCAWPARSAAGGDGDGLVEVAGGRAG